jgi:hypothetical protein
MVSTVVFERTVASAGTSASAASAIRALVQQALEELAAMPAEAAHEVVGRALRVPGASSGQEWPPALRRAFANPAAGAVVLDLFAHVLHDVLKLGIGFAVFSRLGCSERPVIRFEISLQVPPSAAVRGAR